ncbi:PREDICTED: uncharacterized protein LOC105559407 [Vollenhovia emeryi]|uniref:uncharacterized protein LOC105559407 n=1 Tax=Vollenhovia emeryi TaxID=411798 RepID=UPI0005F4ED0A|nr:PREDICTED: uncharacterized protein LOC105559407 [Vollenhovia emeryi]
MNSDTRSVDASKYEKLVTNARKICDSQNQPIQQKHKTDSYSLTSTSHTLPSSTKRIDADKYQTHKLVDSKQVSGPFRQFDKKTFLLDTYARIVANNNRRCPK